MTMHEFRTWIESQIPISVYIGLLVVSLLALTILHFLEKD